MSSSFPPLAPSVTLSYPPLLSFLSYLSSPCWSFPFVIHLGFQCFSLGWDFLHPTSIPSARMPRFLISFSHSFSCVQLAPFSPTRSRHEGWQFSHSLRDFVAISLVCQWRCSGSNSCLVQLEQELDDLRTLVVAIQEQVGTLTSQVLAVLELAVHHRQSFQSFHDEVDALRIQLEEIRNQLAFYGQSGIAPRGSKSANCSQRPQQILDLNALALALLPNQNEDMDEAEDMERSLS